MSLLNGLLGGGASALFNGQQQAAQQNAAAQQSQFSMGIQPNQIIFSNDYAQYLYPLTEEEYNHIVELRKTKLYKLAHGI